MSGVHSCPVCQRCSYRPLHIVRGTPIVCCRGCGLATWAWPPFEPPEFYDASYWRSADIGKGYADYFALAEALRATNAARARLLRRLLAREAGRDADSHRYSTRPSHAHAPTRAGAHPPRFDHGVTASASPPRLLDIGCGPGYFLQAAVTAGFAARGVEASAFAARFAREQLGVDVWQGLARREDLGDDACDVVTMWDVIEHLPDPRASLSAAAAITRPGGLLALSTGDRSSLVARVSGRHWHLYNLPEHLWFFTAGGLRRLLQEVGFAPLHIAYEACWYPLRYLVERLEASLRAGRVFSHRLGYLGRAVMPVTLGDIVTIVARRA